MKTITLTKGISGSGKTYWAREQVDKNNGNTININKDDLRAMLHNNHFSKGREDFVLKTQEAITQLALNEGKNVIWSDTNLNPIHWERAQKYKNQTQIVWKDLTDVPLELCIERDSKRENPVGEKVIRDQYKNYIQKIPEPIVWDVNKLYACVCDIDGTLTTGPKNRGVFDWNKVDQDEVNEYVADLVRMYKQKPNHVIIIVSGRDGSCRDLTEKWLKENNIPYDMLIMREPGDMRADDIVKEEIIDTYILPEYNIKVWIDDRLKVVRMVYNKGIPLLRVGDPEAIF